MVCFGIQLHPLFRAAVAMENTIAQPRAVIGFAPEKMKRWRQTDPKKARMAVRWRAETTMAWEWISKRFQGGHWRTAADAMSSG
jgi:hypothetical protein